MNVQEYIESGIIESYVMGLASEPERAEFERYCAQYPELVAARRKFEEKLEAYAAENAVPPPPEVKVKVLTALRMESPKGDPKTLRTPVMLKFLAAASVILLVAMGYMYYQSQQQNKDLSQTNERLKEQMNADHNTLEAIIKEQNVVRDPNTVVVNMVGTKVAPKSSANIYWDSASTNVYLVVKNMPKLPNDRQYQLWALIDGKPKDLGVFDASNEKMILKMQNTQKAQAFAITIEKKGGSPTPHLDSLQSMGKTLLTQ